MGCPFLQEFPQCVAEPDATARVGEEVPGHSPDWRARIGDEHRVLEDLILYKVVFAEADVSALDFDRMFRARAVRVGVTVALGASWRCVRGFEADLARKGAGGVGSKVVLINIDSGGSNRHGLRARTESPQHGAVRVGELERPRARHEPVELRPELRRRLPHERRAVLVLDDVLRSQH